MSMERKKVTGEQYVTRAELLDFNARVCEPSARCVARERARERLEQALRAAGRDQAEAAAIVARLKAARQGKPADELAVYDEVKGLCEGLVRDGRKESESDLVALCGEKALIHIRAGDAPGAIQEYNQAIAIQERLIKQESRRDLVIGLAGYYISIANVVGALGGNRGTVLLRGQWIAISQVITFTDPDLEKCYVFTKLPW